MSVTDNGMIECNPVQVKPAEGPQYASGGLPGMTMTGGTQADAEDLPSKSDAPDLMMIQLSSFEGRADQHAP